MNNFQKNIYDYLASLNFLSDERYRYYYIKHSAFTMKNPESSECQHGV